MPTTSASAPAPRPPAVQGFQAVQRFFDSGTGRWTARVLPGEFYVTRNDEAIATVLGSCIAACIGDRGAGVGGMNHFMLPGAAEQSANDHWLDPSAGLATRYGSHAMESLINELTKLGARRNRLEIKLFGAGRILASDTEIGARNIAFVHEYLKTEGLPVAAADLGDIYPRRVIYLPATGKVRVRRLRPIEGTEIAEREKRYLNDIARRGAGGEVELFD